MDKGILALNKLVEGFLAAAAMSVVIPRIESIFNQYFISITFIVWFTFHVFIYKPNPFTLMKDEFKKNKEG